MVTDLGALLAMTFERLIWGYTFMSRNKQAQKYLIGHSYKNAEFDWLFDLLTVT